MLFKEIQINPVVHSEVYGPLHEMVYLKSSTLGFDLRDEYSALWNLLHRSDVSEQLVFQQLSERIQANLLTYAIEKDASDYELEYVLLPTGPHQWKLTTKDHQAFPCLSQMALEAVKKTKATNQDWQYEQAVYQGVVSLKEKLIHEPIGTKIALIYPPIPDSDQTVLYTYESVAENPETGGIQIKVQGAPVPLNLKGAGQFYFQVNQSTETDLAPHFLTSHPFVTAQSFQDLLSQAINLCFNQDNRTSIDLSNKYSQAEISPLYYLQIAEAATFLTECLRREYDLHHGQPLSQPGLDNLELAFSFARRSILKARRHLNNVNSSDAVISSAELLHAYLHKLKIESAYFTSEDEVFLYNQHVYGLFGATDYQLDRAAGCPSAALLSIGATSPNSSVSNPITSETAHCPEKKCARCGNKDIAETDTQCRKCSWKPGEPINQTNSDSRQKDAQHYQQQVAAEKLKLLTTNNEKHKKNKKSPPSLWLLLFGLSK